VSTTLSPQIDRVYYATYTVYTTTNTRTNLLKLSLHHTRATRRTKRVALSPFGTRAVSVAGCVAYMGV